MFTVASLRGVTELEEDIRHTIRADATTPISAFPNQIESGRESHTEWNICSTNLTLGITTVAHQLLTYNPLWIGIDILTEMFQNKTWIANGKFSLLKVAIGFVLLSVGFNLHGFYYMMI
jgi:hypothetical protein